MTAVPALPSAWAVGKIRASNLELMRLVSAFLLAPPTFKGRQGTLQSISSATYTPITWDTEDVDSAGGHSTSSNTSRYTAVYPGWYLLNGGVAFAASATASYRQTAWSVNGSIVTDYINNATTIASVVVSLAARGTTVYLNVGDYVELQGWQNTGGALNTSVASGLQSSMTVTWVSN